MKHLRNYAGKAKELITNYLAHSARLWVVALLAMMSSSVWGTTTSSAVIFPAGTTSSYTAGEWGDHGAYIGSYPTSEATESMCISDGNGYDMKFYYAYDGGTANGLQLKRNSDAYVKLTVASSNGVSVEITYRNPNSNDDGAGAGFTVNLTGASDVAASGSLTFTTTTISTTNTNATLTINGGTNVVYIKYIKITPRNSGTITIGHDDCVVGPQLAFSTTTLSKTVTPAEAESGGNFSTISITGSNLEPCSYVEEVYYEFENASPSATWDDDWVFEISPTSTTIVGGSISQSLTISYTFITTPSPGNYSVDLYAWYWNDDCNTWTESNRVTVTLTVAAACNANPTIGNASVASSFTLTSLTGAVNVSSGSCSPGSGCEWTDFGLTWGTSSTPTGNKKTVASSGATTSFANNIQPSNSTSPTSWTVGTTYYVRTYGKNGKEGATYVYGSATSFVLRSITFNSNGGSAVGPWYVKSGGTYSAPTAPTKTGYDFAGWYTDNGTFESPVDWTAAVSANKTYYAKWTAKDVAITLKKNNSDASGSTDGSASVKYDATALTSISHATRANYRLEGYYAESACTHKVITDAGVLVNYSGYVESGKWVRSSATDLYANWTAVTYSDYKFSCAELTLTPVLVTSGTPIFITSTASKKVRSQDYIQITGSGLTPSTALTFPSLPATFEIKTATYGALATDASGAIDEAAYIFYTPDAGSTTDGLDEISGITVSVSGAKAKQVSLVQSIIGRHLPADFVIAGKKDGKWYALPDTMTQTTHPVPIEIAVDNADNPSVAYTAATNIYNLYGQNSGAGYLEEAGQYVKLGMKNNPTFTNYPLLGTTSTAIGKSTGTDPTHNLDKQYWWLFTQTNTSITDPQDAKYIIYCANNTTNHLRLKDNSGNPKWGLYDSGIEELRLIPASSIVFAEAEIVEWGQHGAIIEVDATAATGIDATSVIAHLGEATSSAITLVQTKAGDAKNNTSKYNYTVNFGDGIDFADAESYGAMLTLEWKKDATVKAMSNIIVPKIVAGNITINKTNYPNKSVWNTEVHLLPGKKITVEADYSPYADVTIKELNIYPGATVDVESGKLIATTLVMRNGWTRAGSKKYDVARLYIDGSANLGLPTNAYADWYIDYDQYYPVAVPWSVTTSSMSYLNSNNAASAGVKLRYYDGASRAENGQTGVADGANWKEYSPLPATLTPGLGYAMTARRPTGKAFSIVRMPLTIPSATWTTGGEKGNVSDTYKDQVAVTAHGADAEPAKPTYLVGWNFIGNPYMSIYQGELTHSVDGEEIAYVNIPDESFRDYGQYPAETKKLLPASGFFIQTSKTGTLTFGSGNRKASAPAYHNAAQTESVPVQKAYIDLTSETEEDMMGIWVADKYTEAYEMNADLEKLLGDGTSLRTYMRYGDMNMAYVAINETLAKEWIPVLVRIPETGEYTFSLNSASKVSELEGVYLIDYENGDLVTNLLESNYTFFSESGTISGRFAINAVVGNRVPTAIDAVGAGDATKPVKFIYRDQMYILLNGVIYDATGKKVREINK